MERVLAVDQGAAIRLRGDLLRLTLLAPLLIYLLVFFVYPTMQMLVLAFYEKEPTIMHFARLFTTPVYLQVLWITFRTALIVTALCVLLGYPVAYLLTTTSWRAASLLLLFVLLPFWSSFLVRTFSWMILLQERGVINRFLLGLGLVESPLRLMYNRTGVYIGMVHVLLPYTILTAYSVMRGIDLGLVRAAHTLGAGPARAFARVFLPLSLPGVAAGGLLVFVLSLGFFITPALLGGRTDVMMAQVIENQVNLLANWHFGSALAALLLVVTVVIYVAYERLLGLDTLWGGMLQSATPREVRWVGITTWTRRLLAPVRWAVLRVTAAAVRLTARIPGLPMRGASLRPGRVVLWGISVAVLGFLCLPVLLVIPMSFGDSTFLEFPPRALSLHWYRTYLGNAPWIWATWWSLEVGVLTMVLSTVLGTAAAAALTRVHFPGKTAVNALILSPMIVPKMVFAIGIYFLYARLNLVGSVTGLVLSHTVLAVPLVVVTVTAAFQGVDVRLEQAALTLGASPLRAFLRVTFPAIRTGILSGALFAFITSFDELIVAMFVTGTLYTTLPKKMWDDMLFNVTPTIAAVSSILIAITTVLFLLSAQLRRAQGAKER